MTFKWSQVDPPRWLHKEEEWLSQHEAAARRLHPDLERAYAQWQLSGYAGSIYDYFPGNYRSVWK